MGGWTLDEIPWREFDPSRVDPEIVPIIKAASMVEYNAGDYRTYLKNVFRDDPRFVKAIEGWAEEEVQHGRALARWAELADPSFDFEASFARFRDGYRVPLEVVGSVRGSLTGELIARCMVETGTSSYYSALTEATEEPVLKEICRRIANDEFAHYDLFYKHMTRYLEREKLGFWERLRIALGRITESEDDELAYAYYAANGGDAPYDRRANASAYGRKAMSYYTPGIVERGIRMVFAAIGLKGSSPLGQAAGKLGWVAFRIRIYLLGRAVA